MPIVVCDLKADHAGTSSSTDREYVQFGAFVLGGLGERNNALGGKM
jgi:hypothetical protein